jgi:hypothetical protein
MKIASFSIQNYRCIKDLNVNCLDDEGKVRQWTVLLGENNSGKTNVLRALALLAPEKLNLPGLDKIFVSSFLARTRDRLSLRSFYDSYLKLKAKLENGKELVCDPRDIQVFDFDPEIRLFGYGVSRYPARTALNEVPSLSTETLFSTYVRLLDFQDWLLQLDYSAKHDSEIARSRLQHMRELVRSNLFPGVVDFCFEKTGENDHVVVKFTTEHDGNVCFEDLGFGYQTTLTWLADFCKRMFDEYPESENPLQEEAVVMIDELDLHLHPKWQRDIVPTLSEYFPNVQFIVTTHSPHVLQSMEDVNLYVLRRGEESGEITAERSDVTNFTGWTVEDILCVTMELGDDVLSVAYNAVKKDFEEALRNKNRAAAQRYYERLDDMMRPGNPMRSIYRVRLEEMA